AAHKASPGDRLIICTYAVMSEQEVRAHRPRLVYLNEHNEITRTANTIPVQAA
ncbi:MAG: aspartate 1-decarboxylase, partial [Gammaproteobacteria bacterium]